MTDETRDLTPPPFVPYIPGPPEPPQEYTLFTAAAVTEPHWPEPAPVPRHPAWVVPAVIILTLGVMAAAVAIVALVVLSPDPTPAPTATSNTTNATVTPAPVDSFAVRACGLVVPLANADGVQDPVQLEELGNLAAMSQDPAIALEGRRLALSAEIARNATGADDEQLAKLDLFTATLKMATACMKGGYVTPR